MMELMEPLSEWTGIPGGWLLGILAVSAILLLRWGFRNPWSLVRVIIIVSLLGGAAYAAFQLTKSGTIQKKALIEEKPLQ